MSVFFLFLFLLLILGIASRYWGADSTDKINSCEWGRRRWRDEQGY